MRSILLPLALLCALAAPALAQDGPVSRTLASAIDAYDDGNLRGALTILREAQKAAPQDPRVLVWLARVHADLGRDDLAIDYLTQAASTDPEVSRREALLYGRVLQRSSGLRASSVARTYVAE